MRVLHVTLTGITLARVTTISLKVTDSLLRRLNQAASSRGVTKSHLVREVLSQALETRANAEAGSCYDLARDLAGCVQGVPKDLATNPAYLEAFGK